MDPTIIVAIISLVGTLLCSFLGGIASSRLTQHRIQELEKKVDKHNNLIERMYKLEGKVEEIEHDIRELRK